jgi:hypothetical protein
VRAEEGGERSLGCIRTLQDGPLLARLRALKLIGFVSRAVCFVSRAVCFVSRAVCFVSRVLRG